MDTDPLPSELQPLTLLILLSESINFHAPYSWIGWSALIFTALICLLLSAFISGSEIAYFGLSSGDIDILEESEKGPEHKAANMLADSEKLLATILISNNLVNITMVVLLSYAFQQVITITNGALNFLLQTVVLTFILLLFGEIFPKLVARSNPLRWVRYASSPLFALFKILTPFSVFMVKSTSIVNKYVTKKEETLSTDELEKALQISDIKEGEEKDMLEGILSFGEKEVSEIMISRVDITGIEFHASWNEAMEIILNSGYSRIPVYDTSQDSIRGILYSKDLLPYIGKNDENFKWQDILREPYFVPESRRIDDLLEDFRKRKIHIAIVVDEYGGTQGMVTLEDIIEEIVGEIDDEHDVHTSFFRRINSSTFIFDGKTSISDFCDAMDIDEEEMGEYGEAETLAGYLLEIKGDFPTLMETFEKGRFKFQVTGLERHRITKIKVTILPDKQPEKDTKKQ